MACKIIAPEKVVEKDKYWSLFINKVTDIQISAQVFPFVNFAKLLRVTF